MRRFALATLLLAGACDASGELHRRHDPGALVVAEAADVISLDPLRVTDSESVQVGELLYEGLVGWRPGTTDIEPRLAKDWQVSADGRTWTFHLRDHVAFHDGSPMDAEAVAFSFERLLDPQHPSFIGTDAGNYWRTLLHDIEHVVVVDPLTVEIFVMRPHSPLLGDLVKFPIVSPTAVRRWGNAFEQHPIGTGPFSLETWTPGEQVVVN